MNEKKISIETEDASSYCCHCMSCSKTSQENTTRGIVVTIASFFANMIADGCTFSFGVYFIELLKIFEEPKAKTSWVGSLIISMPLVCGPIASAFTNCLGFRVTTMLGGIISCLGCVASVFINSIDALSITYGVITGFGLSLIYVPAVVLVTYYFDDMKGFAIGVAVAGSGIGVFIFAPLSEYLIEEYSWKGALLITGGIMLNITICGALFKDPNMKFYTKNGSYSSLNADDSLKVSESERIATLKRYSLPDVLEFKDAIILEENYVDTHNSSKYDNCDINNANLISSRQDNISIHSINNISNIDNKNSNEILSAKHDLNVKSVNTDISKYGCELLNCDINIIINSVNNVLNKFNYNNHLLSIKNTDETNINDSTNSLYLNKINSNKKDELYKDCQISDSTKILKDKILGSYTDSHYKNNFEQNDHDNVPLNTKLDINLTNSLLNENKIHMNNIYQVSSSNKIVPNPYSSKDNPCKFNTNMFHNKSLSLCKLRGGMRAGFFLPIGPQAISCPNIASRTQSESETNKSKKWYSHCDTKIWKKPFKILKFSLFKNAAFNFLFLHSILLFVSYGTPYVFLPDKALIDGLSNRLASTLLSVMGLFSTFGQLMIGYLADKPYVNSLYMYNCLIILSGLLTIFVPFYTEYLSLVLYCIGFGFSISVIYVLTPVILEEIFGKMKLTSAIGLMSLAQGVSNLLGPPFAGWISDYTGSYGAAFYLAGLTIVVSGVMLFLLPYIHQQQNKL